MEYVYLALVIAAIIAAGIVRARLQSVTVFEYERGLRFRRGKFIGIVEPGSYWLWSGRDLVRKVDTRLRIIAMAGQEVLSADGVALKVSVSASYRIADPARAVLELENPETALYSALQLALRAIIAASPVEGLLAQRATIGPQLLKDTVPAAAALGLTLESADLKDLTLPGDLKKIFAQVVRAKQEGLAALERARGETAALRNLTNAARLVTQNPPLLQLRWLQVLSERGGNTVVLGVPSGAVPIGASGDAATLPEPEGD